MSFFKKILSMNLEIKNYCGNPKIVFYILGLKLSFTFRFLKIVQNYWQPAFSEYFKENDMKEKTRKLKEGLDENSIDYIEMYMKLFPYVNKFTRQKQWTERDNETFKDLEEFLKTFKQPYPELVTINPYYYSNMYGLKDLPKEALEAINGKAIVDGGGYLGDTPIVFNTLFPDSKIFAFEPIKKFIDNMNLIVDKGNFEDKILPVNKALGNECKTELFEYGQGNKNEVEVTTLDEFFKNSNETIGLIKLDTEGFETRIVEGAKEIIKTQKPVLAIAMYHTPEDFFDLKDKIKSMNPEYKFMIRRSEAVLPMADLVLIAY